MENRITPSLGALGFPFADTAEWENNVVCLNGYR